MWGYDLFHLCVKVQQHCSLSGGGWARLIKRFTGVQTPVIPLSSVWLMHLIPQPELISAISASSSKRPAACFIYDSSKAYKQRFKKVIKIADLWLLCTGFARGNGGRDDGLSNRKGCQKRVNRRGKCQP